MRSTYQLNTEKLEYNFRVLSERDFENAATIGQQKRKLARLQDSLSGLVARYGKTDRQFKEENMALSEEYRRITEQFQDLKGKFQHFQVADANTFDEVWAMKEEQVKGLLSAVLTADKLVHEQQLGLYWYPPNETAVNAALDAARQLARAKSLSRRRMAVGGGTVGGGWGAGGLGGGVQALLTDASQDVARMNALLCDEAGFLVESKERQLLEEMGRVKGYPMRGESILKALGVTSERDMERLLGYFVQEGGDFESGTTRRRLRLRVQEGEGGDTAAELIGEDQVLLAIKHFLKDQPLLQRDRRRSSVALAALLLATPEGNGGGGEGVFGMGGTDRHGMDRVDGGEVWAMCANIVSPKTFRVWGALEKCMMRYNATLTRRAELIEETAGLRGQNEELKLLLNQYLGSKINQELYVPPTATISRLDGQDSGK
jgi:dynein regulatry complex protein 1